MLAEWFFVVGPVFESRRKTRFFYCWTALRRRFVRGFYSEVYSRFHPMRLSLFSMPNPMKLEPFGAFTQP